MCYILGLTWCCLKATVTDLCQSAKNFIHLGHIDISCMLKCKLSVKETHYWGYLLYVAWKNLPVLLQSNVYVLQCSLDKQLSVSCGPRLWSIFKCWRRNLLIWYFHLESKIIFSLRTTFSSRHFVNLDFHWQ